MVIKQAIIKILFLVCLIFFINQNQIIAQTSDADCPKDNWYVLGLLKNRFYGPYMPSPCDYGRRIYGIGIGLWSQFYENNIDGIGIVGSSELLQINGILLGINSGFSSLNGVSLSLYHSGSGFHSYNFNGLAIAGIYSSNKNKGKGILVGGIFTESNDLHGVLLAGVFNSSNGLEGLGISPIFNYSRDYYGVSITGLVNYTHYFNGVSLSLLANLELQKFIGVQISSLNYTKEFSGLQLAPINYSNYSRGFQFGLINKSENLIGIQIGLINIVTNRLKGIQIGLLNYASNSQIFPILPLFNCQFSWK